MKKNQKKKLNNKLKIPSEEKLVEVLVEEKLNEILVEQKLVEDKLTKKEKNKLKEIEI